MAPYQMENDEKVFTRKLKLGRCRSRRRRRLDAKYIVNEAKKKLTEHFQQTAAVSYGYGRKGVRGARNENSRLKRMYANLSLVHEALKDAVAKKL